MLRNAVEHIPITRTMNPPKKKLAKSKSKSVPVAKKAKKPAQKKQDGKAARINVAAKKKVTGKQTLHESLPSTIDSPLLRWRQEVLLGPGNVYDKYPAIKFGYYQESAASAMMARKKAPKVFQAPLPLDRFDSHSSPGKNKHGWVEFPNDGVIHFLYFREDGRWLGFCKKNISEAVENGDEAFFLNLARVISERPKYRGNSIDTLHAFGRPSDPKPGTLTDRFRDLLIYNWIPRPLWLMSSTVACDYIRKFGGLEITPDNYNKIKNELGLEQHPKLPVVGVTDNGELVLKAGWKFPKS